MFFWRCKNSKRSFFIRFWIIWI